MLLLTPCRQVRKLKVWERKANANPFRKISFHLCFLHVSDDCQQKGKKIPSPMMNIGRHCLKYCLKILPSPRPNKKLHYLQAAGLCTIVQGSVSLHRLAVHICSNVNQVPGTKVMINIKYKYKCKQKQKYIYKYKSRSHLAILKCPLQQAIMRQVWPCLFATSMSETFGLSFQFYIVYE